VGMEGCWCESARVGQDLSGAMPIEGRRAPSEGRGMSRKPRLVHALPRGC